MFQRLLRGDRRKVSRFHDFAGNAAPLPAFVHLPTCIASTVTKKITGTHPRGPWIGYRAIRRIDRLVHRDWRILEFGAGNSTPWLAERSAQVVSIEGDVTWHGHVTKLVRSTPNVELILEPPPYDSLMTSLPPTFDFCLVDGLARDRAIEVALAKVRPGGFVYLDNSDVQDAEHQKARSRLLATCGSGVETYVDFSPGVVTVTQGLLGRIPT